MARTRRTTHTRIAPDSVIVEMRSRLPRVVALIATAIQQEVEAYAGPVLGERRKLIENALGAGWRELMDRIGGKARPNPDVDEMFRRLGRAEALDGHTLEAIRCAHDVATREAWDELHRIALSHGLPTSVLGRLGDALFEQIGHLRDEVEAGYLMGVDERSTDVRLSRERLARQLLDSTEETELEGLAAAAKWLLPELVLVVCVRQPDNAPPLEPDLLRVDALLLVDSPYVLLLCDARKRDDAIQEAREAFDHGLISVGIPMPPIHVNTAARLAKRAHQLAEQRLIEARGTIDCADHEESLWLHAEPLLRERLAERLLAPLAAETPHRRRMLARTLLIRLEQRASAPAIARELGVHPQTIRHRLRQLDVMFDERLDDPRLAFPMLLALKATMPSWVVSQPSDEQA